MPTGGVASNGYKSHFVAGSPELTCAATGVNSPEQQPRRRTPNGRDTGRWRDTRPRQRRDAAAPEAAEHAAAVAVFGNPVDNLLGPLNGLSPAHGSKTIDLCDANDPICGEGEMDNMAAHHQYVPGRTDQAASFVAGLV